MLFAIIILGTALFGFAAASIGYHFGVIHARMVSSAEGEPNHRGARETRIRLINGVAPHEPH
jgi:hypothetical protein